MEEASNDSGEQYEEFDEFNMLICDILNRQDMNGLHNNLIINDDYMKLNDHNIHSLIMFVYSSL
jgi:hypothetical protein